MESPMSRRTNSTCLASSWISTQRCPSSSSPATTMRFSKCADRVQCRPNPNRSDFRMEYFELIACPSQWSACLAPTTKESSVRLRCGRNAGFAKPTFLPISPVVFCQFLGQFVRVVLNPYIDLPRIPTTSPSSGRRSPSDSSEQASLSTGDMKYALEMSKTTISSSSSSALLLGSSLLTILRITLKSSCANGSSSVFALSFLPTSLHRTFGRPGSTLSTQTHRTDTVGIHLRFGSGCPVMEMDFFAQEISLSSPFLTRSAGSDAPCDLVEMLVPFLSLLVCNVDDKFAGNRFTQLQIYSRKLSVLTHLFLDCLQHGVNQHW